jgi:S-adenosylmethionine hydrolase
MGCITLLSDFGLQDGSVAAVKGVLMQHAPNVEIVDISHLIEPFHLQQAAYILTEAYRSFAPGTVHVALFDIFSENSPRLLLCEKDGQYFLAPDNGLLSLAFGNAAKTVWSCFELPPDSSFNDWLNGVGRISRSLQAQKPESLGLEPCDMKNAPNHCQPVINMNTVECQVIHIDRYENVVINLTREQFEEIGGGRRFSIRFMRDEEINEISNNYYNVREGDKLCRFNSSGYLEIAINKGKAASLFGLQLFKERHLMYNTIKISFE